MADLATVLGRVDNPFRGQSEGPLGVSLEQAARIAFEQAEHLRLCQQALISTGDRDKPHPKFLRLADAFEKMGLVVAILSLNEDRSRRFLEELKALHE